MESIGVVMKILISIIMALSANQFDVDSLSHELHCLQQNVYFEARNQSFDGMRAVATVTLNRYAQEGFPDKICDVVFQRNKNGRYQFSWVGEKKNLNASIRTPAEYAAWLLAGEAAVQTLFNGGLPELEDAQYFHATYVRSRFHEKNLEVVATIDDHIFYRMP